MRPRGFEFVLRESGKPGQHLLVGGQVPELPVQIEQAPVKAVLLDTQMGGIPEVI